MAHEVNDKIEFIYLFIFLFSGRFKFELKITFIYCSHTPHHFCVDEYHSFGGDVVVPDDWNDDELCCTYCASAVTTRRGTGGGWGRGWNVVCNKIFIMSNGITFPILIKYFHYTVGV